MFIGGGNTHSLLCNIGQQALFSVDCNSGRQLPGLGGLGGLRGRRGLAGPVCVATAIEELAGVNQNVPYTPTPWGFYKRGGEGSHAQLGRNLFTGQSTSGGCRRVVGTFLVSRSFIGDTGVQNDGRSGTLQQKAIIQVPGVRKPWIASTRLVPHGVSPPQKQTHLIHQVRPGQPQLLQAEIIAKVEDLLLVRMIQADVRGVGRIDHPVEERALRETMRRPLGVYLG